MREIAAAMAVILASLICMKKRGSTIAKRLPRGESAIRAWIRQGAPPGQIRADSVHAIERFDVLQQGHLAGRPCVEHMAAWILSHLHA